MDKGDQTKLRNLHQQRNELQDGTLLFENRHQREQREKKIKKLDKQIAIKEARLKEINDAQLFANSFEWQFEFP